MAPTRQHTCSAVYTLAGAAAVVVMCSMIYCGLRLAGDFTAQSNSLQRWQKLLHEVATKPRHPPWFAQLRRARRRARRRGSRRRRWQRIDAMKGVYRKGLGSGNTLPRSSEGNASQQRRAGTSSNGGSASWHKCEWERGGGSHRDSAAQRTPETTANPRRHAIQLHRQARRVRMTTVATLLFAWTDPLKARRIGDASNPGPADHFDDPNADTIDESSDCDAGFQRCGIGFQSEAVEPEVVRGGTLGRPHSRPGHG